MRPESSMRAGEPWKTRLGRPHATLLGMTGAAHRGTIIDIEPVADADGVPMVSPIRVRAESRQIRAVADGPPVEVAGLLLTADVAADRTLASMELSGADLSAAELTLARGLVGQRVASGFRAKLGELRATPAGRMTRRVLWDLPIVVMVSGSAKVVDHPSITPPDGPLMSLAGADQCSGWRTGGTMLTKVVAEGGRVRMRLGPAVTPDTRPAWPADGWLADAPPLVPMGFRRARSISVDGDVSTVRFRDSYADPDGIERALHEWTVTATMDPESGTFAAISVAPGQLPWFECPWAGGSGAALQGVRPEDVDSVASADLYGTTTCTHLNDTLRSLTEIPDVG
jgi:Protein of unknown function (DUF2889)